MTFIITRLRAAPEFPGEVTKSLEVADSPFFLYEDLLELVVRATDQGHERKNLRWCAHSPHVMGLHALSWGCSQLGPKNFVEIYTVHEWPYPTLLGIGLTYDKDVAPCTIKLECRPNGEHKNTLLGLLRTHLTLSGV